ncbi:hypothetical protein HanIR_Chr13g0643001 [Helianthus annuus]|nr:hypothetical protein HanIR_Chr13g0643001 [Helianthus annuus]
MVRSVNKIQNNTHLIQTIRCVETMITTDHQTYQRSINRNQKNKGYKQRTGKKELIS